MAGSGIGTFLFAPLTKFLIDCYGWRGTVLIIGGIMLNITVCGTVFRPLVSPKLERRRRRYKASMERFTKMCSRQQLDQQQQLSVAAMATSQHQINQLMHAPVTQSLMQFPTHITIMYPELLDADHTGKTLHQVLAENNLLDKFSHSLTDLQQSNSRQVWKNNKAVAMVALRKPPSFQCQPLQRKDIFYRGSLARGTDVVKASASCPNIHVHYDEDDDDEDSELWTNWFRFSRSVKHILREMMDVSILRSAIFVYLCMSTFLLYLSYDVPYVFTPDKAIGMGISQEKASFLVSIIGITSTFGQIAIGYIGDLPQVNAVLLYSVLTSIAGLVTLLVPWYYNYVQLCAFTASYGFFISANYTLTTILLVNLLGMDKLTNAYGIEMLSEGIANLIGPPLAGESFTSHVLHIMIYNGIQ